MIDNFLAYLTSHRRYSLLTVSAYRVDLEQLKSYFEVAYHLNITLPSDAASLTPKMVKNWTVTHGNYLNSSLRRKLSALKSYVEYLVNQGLITRNPIEAVTLPPLKRKLPEILSAKQLNQQLESIPAFIDDDFNKALISVILELIYGCGLRRSELLNLKLDDIDLTKQSLLVSGKGNKQRLIPFNQPVKIALETYLALRSSNSNPNNQYLLVNKQGRRIGVSSIRRYVKRYLEGFGTLTYPHLLRHCFASHLLDGGASIAVVKLLLGHSSLAATNVYLHTSVKQLKDKYKRFHPKS